MKNSVFMLVGLSACAAHATETRPSVVVLPLDVALKTSPAKFELGMRNAYFTMVELDSGAVVTSKRETETALTATKRQDFRDSDEALAQLAVKAKTLYALHAWTDVTTGKQLTLHGRVVRDDGKAMGSAVVQVPLKGEKPDKAMKKLTKDLLAQLKLGELPAQKEVVVAPPPVETPPVEVKKDPPPDFVPPPPPPLVEVRDEGAGQRAAGQGVFVTGLAVAAAGGIVAAIGGAVGGNVQPQEGTGFVHPKDLNSAVTGRTLTTAGFIGIGVGAATAIVGAIVWGTAPAKPKTEISVSPMAGGAMVQVGGRF